MRNEIDSAFVFGEIKMWDVKHRKKQHIGIIVEAKTDENLFGNMFQKDCCIFFHANGWSKAIPAIKQVNQHSIKGVICIIDADFRRIENEIPEIDNLFMTDHHDAEMMMIASPAWESLINEYADTSAPKNSGLSKLAAYEKKSGYSIKDHLLQSCQPLSCLILLNEREHLSLEFKKFIKKKGSYKYLDYSRFINSKDLSVSIDDLISTVEGFSVRHNLFRDKPELREALDELIAQEYDLLEFCNGHHLINILSLALENAIGNKSVSRDEIETNLRIAYRFEDFQQTILYKDLKSWESQNNPPYQLFELVLK